MKKRICISCLDELPKEHVKEGNLRFCNLDCKQEFLKEIPPNADIAFIRKILE